MIALSRELALAAESLPHGPGPKAPSAFGMEVGVDANERRNVELEVPHDRSV